MNKYYLLFVLGLFIASCATEKSVRSSHSTEEQCSEYHGNHSGKYKGCSLCIRMTEHIEEESTSITATDYEEDAGIEVLEEQEMQLEQPSSSITTKTKTRRKVKPEDFTYWDYQLGSDTTINENESEDLQTYNPFGNYDPKVNGLGLAGFICGVVGITYPLLFLISPFILPGLGLLLCILGIIFGAIGMGQIKKHPEKWNGRGFAIAGFVTGIVGVALSLLSLVLVILLLGGF